MNLKLVALVGAVIVLLIGLVALLSSKKQTPAEQTPAEYYNEHTAVPDPRGGSFTKSSGNSFGYETPSGAANH